MKNPKKEERINAIQKRLGELKTLGYEELSKKMNTYWSEPLKVNETETGQLEISIFFDSKEEDDTIRVSGSYDWGTFLSAIFPLTGDDLIKRGVWL
jgi:hypothetical protein